jgi:hypothetical protein
MSRRREVAVAFDCLLNAILGGYACETISARCYRLRASKGYGIALTAIDKIFFWQPAHCEASFRALRAREGWPAEYHQQDIPK